MKVLMHTCCAPCSVYCIKALDKEGIKPDLFWFNPNIHPYTEYKSRRDCLIEYSKSDEINLKLIIKDDYGVDEFCKNVSSSINTRCIDYCYRVRFEETVKFAKENGYDAFTSTLFVSIYQNHDYMKKICEELAEKYEIKFLYRDFRVGFREGQNEAREKGLYMQKYCGCIFSEEERYSKQIKKDKDYFDNEIVLVRPTMENKEQVMNLRKDFLEKGEEFHGCSGLEECENYEDWLDFEGRHSKKYGDDYTPNSLFLGIRKSDNKLVGFIDLRHNLSSFLLNYGGNIGYSVAVEERRKGYAKQMLILLLDECRKLGLEKVLLTCDKENVGSRKTILSGGGKLENEVKDDVGLSDSGIIQRYWITL